MHPPIKPTVWDSTLEYYARKLFIWFVLPVAALLAIHWWLQRCDCEAFCEARNAAFVELDTGGRFQPWRCVCELDGKRIKSGEW